MRGMRWLVGLTLTLAAAVVGCKQQCFVPECDMHGWDAYQRLLLPENLDTNPTAACQPGKANFIPDVTTVRYPERPIRYMSLQEALAIALEQGVVNGEPALFLNFSGGFVRPISDTLISFFNTRAVTALNEGIADSIRVLALQPAMLGADIENSLAKFDAHWSTAMDWTQTDNPTGSSIISGTGFNALNGMAGTFASGIVKPLPTGGVAGITFDTAYNLFQNPQAGTVNPAYRPTLQFAFEQPLLQAFGVEANELRNAHPGTINPALNEFLPGLARSLVGATSSEGILVTRIRFDQARVDFEREVHILVNNVEAAYWQLYGAYGQLFARENGMIRTFETLKIYRARFEAGGGVGSAPEDYYQTLAQYHLFRSQRLQQLDFVLEAERELRGVLGLPMEDGFRLVPCDPPTLAPYNPDWDSALHEALALKPELVLAREELKTRQLEVLNRKNQLLPDLRFTSKYEITSISSKLDGPNGAFHDLASDHFDNWGLGLELDVPIGFRLQHAALRIARLNLARGYHILRDQEYRVTRLLTAQYREVFAEYDQIRITRAEREGYGRELEALYRQRDAGKEVTQRLLEAERFFSDALVAEYQAIQNYNIVLAGFEYAKGTILQHDSVVIGEGPLPRCAQKRAVEHEREKTTALVLREREKAQEVKLAHAEGPSPKLPVMPEGFTAPSLPTLIHDQPPPPELTPDMVPPMRSLDKEPAPAPEGSRPPVPNTLPAAPGLPATSVPVPRDTAEPAKTPAPVDVKLQEDEPPASPSQPSTEIKIDKPS